MGQDQKDKQNAEGGCRHGEEVDRGHLTEWLVRKMRQVWEGGLRWRGRYLATVDYASSIPNLSSSARMRSAPHSGLV
jgi:hypothetical protein